MRITITPTNTLLKNNAVYGALGTDTLTPEQEMKLERLTREHLYTEGEVLPNKHVMARTVYPDHDGDSLVFGLKPAKTRNTPHQTLRAVG